MEGNSVSVIQALFERHAEDSRDELAVVCGDAQTTYERLNRRANNIAHALTARGVRPDDRVALCAERSIDLVAGMLGILKAGAAYIPLDVSYPAERLAFMLEDAAPAVLLTQKRLQGALSFPRRRIVMLDGDEIGSGGESDRNPDPHLLGLTSRNLAYVIYTSGSTGTPKGVMIEHGGVLNLIRWHCQTSSVTSGSRCSSVAALGFDAAAWEIWPALSSGATLVLAPAEATRDLDTLIAWWAAQRLDVSFLPTPIAELIFSNGVRNPTVRTLLVGGDRLRARPAADSFSLVNNYGPTESTVVSTSGAITESDGVLHIGRPIDNIQIHILDEDLRLVPVGAAGEIYIGGAGIARGYLDRPRLTAELFVPDPFTTEPNARMYRTGDLARWCTDGNIEFLGRADEQVKIRGVRIELGEIEAQLARHGQVREVAVVARDDGQGGKRLVAYFTPSGHGPGSVEELREYLKRLLPEHMIPSAFIAMTRFPVTANGKLDKRALPDPAPDAYAGRPYEPPRGERETVLGQIWQSLLQVSEVSRQDNFFALGGHSLLIVRMNEKLRKLGLSTGSVRVYEAPTLAELASAIVEASTDDADIPSNRIPAGSEVITPDMLPLVSLQPSHIDEIVKVVPGGARNIQDIYPLSPLQDGILFHHLLDEHRGDTYVLTSLIALPARSTLEAFVEGMRVVVRRHDILRTAFFWDQLPRSVQVVFRDAPLSVEELILDRERDLLDQIRDRMRRADTRVDLQSPPLVRPQFAEDDRHDGRCYVLLQFSHLILDHETLDAMLKEVMAHMQGRAHALPRPTPFRTHVAQVSNDGQAHSAKAFFEAKLSDIDRPTAPFGLTDLRGDATRIEGVRQVLDPSCARRLRVQSQRAGVSPATLFHAVWAVLVSRMSALDDVVYGSVLSGRMHGSAIADCTLGMFINTLPLRIRLGKTSVRGLLDQVDVELRELLKHEQASLAVAQRCSGVDGRAPLFSTLLNYVHSIPDPEAERARAALGIEILALEEWTNYPITVSVDDQQETFTLTVQTDRRIDPKRLMAYLTTTTESFVKALESAPQTSPLELEVLLDSERQQLLHTFNGAPADYPEGALIHELFELQVSRAPSAVAVEFDGDRLTYAELNSRANRLAHHLVSKGVVPDQPIGLYLERSLNMIVGLMGILKAGGTYLPLDPTYPAGRLAYILRDAAPRLLVTDGRMRARLRDVDAEVIEIDGNWGETTGQDLKVDGLKSHHLAYVIYTSGSTGEPKGVMVEHRHVVNLWQSLQRVYEVSAPCQKVALNASLSFDASVKQIVQLLSGRTLFVIPQETRLDGHDLVEFAVRNQIEGVDCTPSQLKSWISAGLFEHDACRLRVVLVGGEAISADLWSDLAGIRGTDFYNIYGPTECTVDTTVARVRDAAEQPHIGRPMENSRVYVLNERLQPVPAGVPGEICIGGARVARGYLNQQALTNERFVRDPFVANSDARLYKSGDIGRWREDGTIEYLGRNDGQVKVRGHRIEVGEIEAQLVRHEHVAQAAVVTRQDEQSGAVLVAYVTGRGADVPQVDDLRTHLRAMLPEYMVPSAFVVLEALPLTAHGKLDRGRLPAPPPAAYTSTTYEAPQGAVEGLIAAVWRDVLRIERVGRHDNFFEIGGHSILAMQVLVRLRSILSVPLRMTMLFGSPTVAELAVHVRALCGDRRAEDLNGEGEDIEGLLDTVSTLPESQVRELIGKLRKEAMQ
jgi:amino acid adenylation domain-containing protein